MLIWPCKAYGDHAQAGYYLIDLVKMETKVLQYYNNWLLLFEDWFPYDEEIKSVEAMASLVVLSLTPCGIV